MAIHIIAPCMLVVKTNEVFMTEPVSTAHTISMGALLISGVFLGMPVDALVLGAIAAAVTLGLGERKTPIRASCEVLLSSMVAGAATPVGSYWLASKMLSGMEVEHAVSMTRTVVPVLLGSMTQYFYPIVTRTLPEFIQRKWGSSPQGVKGE